MTGVRHMLFHGALRRGGEAFARLGLGRAMAYAGPASFRGRMHDPGDFPAVVLTPPFGTVQGDLFRILKPQILLQLNAYELYRPAERRTYDPRTGRGSLFLRRTIRVGGVSAIVYACNGRPSGPVVPGGVWPAAEGSKGWARYRRP